MARRRKTMHVEHRILLTFAIAAVLGHAGSAAAQPGSEADVHARTALQIVQRQPLDDEGRRAALDEFRIAYQLGPQCKFLCNIGRLNDELNRSTEAVTALRACAACGQVEEEHRQKAGQRIRELEATIGRLGVRVSMAGTQADGAKIEVDGRVVAVSPLRETIPVEVGPHRVRVILGEQSHEASVNAVAGQETPVVIEFEPSISEAEDGSTPPPPAPASRSSTVPVPRSDRDSMDWLGPSRERTMGWVTVGVGAAGLLTALITASMAWSMEADLDRECPGGHCDRPQWDDADRHRTLGTVSTWSAVAGGVLGCTGAGLILHARSRTPQAASAELGVEGVSLRWRF
jgi:hypothetical protein